MRVWITSDTHFNHKNIIQYSNRPWPDLKAMEDGIVERWNSVVGTTDDVWHLGDFAMGGNHEVEVPRILSRLNGRKRLIKGNHDSKACLRSPQWSAVIHGSHEIEVDGWRVLMRHYNPTPYPDWPEKDWPGCEKGVVLLHGHSHGNCHGYTPRMNSIDVGVDCWNYYPISIQDAVKAATTLPEKR